MRQDSKITKQSFEKIFNFFNIGYFCLIFAALVYNFYVIKSEALFKMIIMLALLSVLPIAYISAYIWSILPDENEEQIAAQYAEYQKLIKELTRGN